MIKGKSILAIIPARGGSKGIPKKNIKRLAGKPLIVWTIEEAKKSKYLDRIVLSSDDEEIIKIAQKNGCEAPFVRPAELAKDNSKSIDAILHALNWFEDNNDSYDIIILLQPTSPLRAAKDIDSSIELLFSKKADSIVSVSKMEHNPLWSNTLPLNGRMDKFLNKKIININRQKLPDYYRLNGAIFIARIDFVKKNLSFFGRNTFAYIMPVERSIDIDSPLDLKFCEFILKAKGI